jgi:hypothetical protein
MMIRLTYGAIDHPTTEVVRAVISEGTLLVVQRPDGSLFKIPTADFIQAIVE